METIDEIIKSFSTYITPGRRKIDHEMTGKRSRRRKKNGHGRHCYSSGGIWREGAAHRTK